MESSEIVEMLDRMPLGQCVREVMEAAAPADITAQAAQLEKQLEMPMPEPVRASLREARGALLEAQRQATLPVQRELVKAVQAVLRREGLVLREKAVRGGAGDGPPGRAVSRRRGPRKSPEERHAQLLGVMDAAEGLPGKDIAEKAGLSYQTVRRYLGAMQEAGLVVRDGRGKNTVWRVAEDEGEDGRKKGGRRKA